MEVLVAVALAGVITAIAVLLLHTTRQVTREVSRPVTTPLLSLRHQMQEDLDHLLTGEILEDQPPLALRDASLELVSLRPDEQGIPHPTLIRYTHEGDSLHRITERGIPLTASTTLVLRAVRTFAPTAFLDGESFPIWPEEDNAPLPQRIELEIDRRDPPVRDTFSLDIPASFRIKSEP